MTRRQARWEEATAACLMVRHACETIIAQNCGKEKAKKCLLDAVRLALDATDEEIEAQAGGAGRCDTAVKGQRRR